MTEEQKCAEFEGNKHAHMLTVLYAVGGHWLAVEMVLEAFGTLEAAGREWGARHTSTQLVSPTSW